MMRCPDCKYPYAKVYDQHMLDSRTVKRRYLKCPKCDLKFKTDETYCREGWKKLRKVAKDRRRSRQFEPTTRVRGKRPAPPPDHQAHNEQLREGDGYPRKPGPENPDNEQLRNDAEPAPNVETDQIDDKHAEWLNTFRDKLKDR